ncbi:MAG: PRC-barrel domain containing protein [Verrucomicrobiota bacterium]|nr:PRC-barrel domain containing protein [Verrucomicrobiota bacterium]
MSLIIKEIKMLRSLNKIHNYVLQAEDGKIGHCKDLLFDDHFWTIRYLVADTGNWLPGLKVLLSPISFGEPDWDSRIFPVRLTKKGIEDAPKLDEHAPVNRQHEIHWTEYYGWPYYWGGSYAWGVGAHPGALYYEKLSNKKAIEVNSESNHLRSVHEVTGYHIKESDSGIGHVKDFLADDKTWSIRYMVVDTHNWLSGKKVLISPDWIDSVDWEENKVSVALTSEQVKNSPEYDPSTGVSREYEVRLHEFYDRPKYWK